MNKIILFLKKWGLVILSVLSFIGGVLVSLLFQKKTEYKIMDYEAEKKETRERIKGQSLKKTIERAKKYFGIILLIPFLSNCGSRARVLVLPEPPLSPKIVFSENVDSSGVSITKNEFEDLIIFLDNMEKYREKLVDFIKELGK